MTNKLVLGVGNTLLTDDAVGIRVAERVLERLGPDDGVEVRFTERGGLDLVELLAGFEEAVVIDAIVSSTLAAGEIVVRDLSSFRATFHLNGAHGVDLPTAVALGRTLDAGMPDRITVVAVVVADPYTLGESLTPEVQGAMARAVGTVLELVRSCPAT